MSAGTTRRAVWGTLLAVIALVASSAVWSPVTPAVDPGSAAHAAGRSAVKAVGLQVGGSADRATVVWFARSRAGQVVQYGRATRSGRIPPRPATTSASARASSEPGWISLRAPLTGLRPGVTYAYRVGSVGGGWSSVARFTVPRGDHGTFLVVGDPQLNRSGRVVRGAAGWASTVRAATRRHPDARFLFSLGDQVDDPSESAEWDAFLAPSQLRAYRLATLVGNHDNARRAPQYGEHMTPPNLSTAGRTAPGTGNSFFVEGKVLVIALNSNEKRISVHRDFVRRVVAAHPRATWRIVGFHHAPFSGSGHSTDADVRAFRAELTPEFGRAGVDLVLGGHDHSYVRTPLMNGARVSQRGSARPTTHRPRPGEVLYLTLNSSSGSKFYPLRPGLPWAARAVQGMRPTWTAVTTSPTALTASTYDSTGALVDRVTLRR